MSKSNYCEAAVLNAIFNNTAFQVAVPWISLHSADPGETGADELSGGGYGRVNGSACFPAASVGTLSNNAAITFPETSADWTEATHFGVYDAETGGNYIRGGALTAARTVTDGDTASFASGAMTCTED